jgi:hypothetical protein
MIDHLPITLKSFVEPLLNEAVEVVNANLLDPNTYYDKHFKILQALIVQPWYIELDEHLKPWVCAFFDRLYSTTMLNKAYAYSGHEFSTDI